MKMTKQEFFEMRDQQRARREIKTDYIAENYENDLLPDEEKRILEALRGQTRGIFRTKELGLTRLYCTELYIGKRIKARRNKVDEIDNITVWIF
jgi:hypothetical protein